MSTCDAAERVRVFCRLRPRVHADEALESSLTTGRGGESRGSDASGGGAFLTAMALSAREATSCVSGDPATGSCRTHLCAAHDAELTPRNAHAASTGEVQVSVNDPRKRPPAFKFDGFFGPDSTQEAVFAATALPVVDVRAPAPPPRRVGAPTDAAAAVRASRRATTAPCSRTGRRERVSAVCRV